MVGESMVFAGNQPAGLAHMPAPKTTVTLRSTYLRGSNTVDYIEGRDFAVDYTNGALRRLANSRLPDFRTNALFGQEGFDHTKFPSYGNGPYFAFADYSFVPGSARWPLEHEPQKQFLKSTLEKLKTGAALKIVAYGDSITAGGEATRPELIFWRRWADSLQQKYPRAKIAALNGATGGDTSFQGIERCEKKVVSEKPDLVLIGFGMNDNNKGGAAIPQFEANLKQIIATVRSKTQAEIVLFSAFPPNPKWIYGTPRMAEYAGGTERVAKEAGCAYADVYHNWQAIAARKNPEDLLGNNINHPNDFGHWIYFRVLEDLGL